ncbi:MAG: cytochrome c biogenesis protein ResB [bacterium]|nr:cytochrome c biogenesis protein ResB [bacterium]
MKKIWGFFSSTRFALLLVILIISACIIGTFIPQRISSPEYIRIYGKDLYLWLNRIGFTDLYHSFWFITLLFLLFINLMICVVNKCFVLRKRKSLFLGGSILTHLSILIILLGGIISGIFGFREYLNINEGATKRISNIPCISIKVNSFNIEYYHGSRQVKDYKTTLTLIEEGKEVISKKVIRINHPLSYKGIKIYQSGYGKTNRVKNVTLKVHNGEKASVHTLKIGERFAIPNTDSVVRIAEFLPDFVMLRSRAISKSTKLNNPALRLEIYEDDRLKDSTWVFHKFPNWHSSKDSRYRFEFTGLELPFYTRLEIVKDPGAPIVFLGCGILIIGLCILLPTIRRRRIEK